MKYPGLTGISHWVEHMQFKGTPQFPAGVLDKAISREGGFWNAFTYLDWTTYFETMPADKIDLALRLEADRMVNSLFDPEEVESERTVIISEREGSENEPLFRLGEAVQAAAFRVHPYHHEVIGDMADLHTIQRDDLYHHYRTYYSPANAVLALAGDFDSRRHAGAHREICTAPLPAALQPPHPACPEPPATEEQRVEVSGPGETTYLQVVYHSPAASHAGFLRLHRAGQPAGRADQPEHVWRRWNFQQDLPPVPGPGRERTGRQCRRQVCRPRSIPTCMISRSPSTPRPTPEDCLQALDDEIKRLQDAPVPEAEVARAIKQARALFAYGSENITNQAFWLGFAEMFASYDWFDHYLDELARVTPADVQRAAQNYLAPQNRVVGIYLPTGEASEEVE